MAPILNANRIEVPENSGPLCKPGWHPESPTHHPCRLPSQYALNDAPPAGPFDKRSVPQRICYPYKTRGSPIDTHCFPPRMVPTFNTKSPDADVELVERGETVNAIKDVVIDQIEDILDKRSRGGGLFTVSELQKRTSASLGDAGDIKGRMVPRSNGESLDSGQHRGKRIISLPWEQPSTSERPASTPGAERELAAAAIIADRRDTTYTPAISGAKDMREINDPDDPSTWVVNDLVARLKRGDDESLLPISPKEIWDQKTHSTQTAQKVLPRADEETSWFVSQPVLSVILRGLRWRPNNQQESNNVVVVSLVGSGILLISIISICIWFITRKRQSRHVVSSNGFQGVIPEIRETPPTGDLGKGLETVDPLGSEPHVSSRPPWDDDVDMTTGKRVSFNISEEQGETEPGRPIVKDFENDAFPPNPVK